VTIFLGICSALACGAWLAAEARLRILDACQSDLKRRYARLTAENHALKRMLGEAILAMPDTPRGRELGDAIQFQAWPEARQRRLERHLSLVDRRPSA
jgi:ribulose bisphosphate carboxylase small subunit